MNGLAAAKDLSTESPRGLDAELEGYAWLPRMLDKARATLAGTPGSYLFGCPVDHTCMARLGIVPELVLELAARHGDDGAVLDALRAHGIPPAAEAWFDGQAVEDELQETGNYLRVRARDALPEANGGRVFAGAEHGATVSVVLIDAAAGDGQEAHAHAVEEVVVVQDGSATFFLGSQQVRIVRAGEVVRIPARVPHRWVVAGDSRFRAHSPCRAPPRSRLPRVTPHVTTAGTKIAGSGRGRRAQTALLRVVRVGRLVRRDQVEQARVQRHGSPGIAILRVTREPTRVTARTVEGTDGLGTESADREHGMSINSIGSSSTADASALQAAIEGRSGDPGSGPRQEGRSGDPGGRSGQGRG